MDGKWVFFLFFGFFVFLRKKEERKENGAITTYSLRSPALRTGEAIWRTSAALNTARGRSTSPPRMLLLVNEKYTLFSKPPYHCVSLLQKPKLTVAARDHHNGILPADSELRPWSHKQLEASSLQGEHRLKAGTKGNTAHLSFPATESLQTSEEVRAKVLTGRLAAKMECGTILIPCKCPAGHSFPRLVVGGTGSQGSRDRWRQRQPPPEGRLLGVPLRGLTYWGMGVSNYQWGCSGNGTNQSGTADSQ